MECETIRLTQHAFARIQERDISAELVEYIIEHGEIIESYPDDTPFPSVLLLGFKDGDAIHVVVGIEAEAGICHVVTAYRPDVIIWDVDFKRRRRT